MGWVKVLIFMYSLQFFLCRYLIGFSVGIVVSFFISFFAEIIFFSKMNSTWLWFGLNDYYNAWSLFSWLLQIFIFYFILFLINLYCTQKNYSVKEEMEINFWHVSDLNYCWRKIYFSIIILFSIYILHRVNNLKIKFICGIQKKNNRAYRCLVQTF